MDSKLPLGATFPLPPLLGIFPPEKFIKRSHQSRLETGHIKLKSSPPLSPRLKSKGIKRIDVFGARNKETASVETLSVISAGVCATVMINAYTCYLGQEPDSDGRMKWVLPYGEPCACTEVRLGGLNTKAQPRPFTPTHIDLSAARSLNDMTAVLTHLNCLREKKGE